ncbi:hypothetical protein EYS14_03885 [Alteromonadaceae bacterium M269]|nr:hypothetical protein EYS14_03885 [Alteromonadaceae bacterium M269]
MFKKVLVSRLLTAHIMSYANKAENHDNCQAEAKTLLHPNFSKMTRCYMTIEVVKDQRAL